MGGCIYIKRMHFSQSFFEKLWSVLVILKVNGGEFLQHTLSNFYGEFLQNTLSHFDSRLW